MMNTIELFEQYAQHVGESIQSRKDAKLTLEQIRAAENYLDSTKHEVDEYEVNVMYGNEDIPTFLEVLKQAGVSTFILTCHITCVADILHQLEAAGCIITLGKSVRHAIGSISTTYEVNGFRIQLPD